jgi:hypothetical protein
MACYLCDYNSLVSYKVKAKRSESDALTPLSPPTDTKHYLDKAKTQEMGLN